MNIPDKIRELYIFAFMTGTYLRKRNILLILFYGLLIFLTFNKHSKSGIFNYHAEIWADKAGYYVYLPATFIYNWNGKAMPDSISDKTGFGFKIEEGGKIRTKYPVGIAIMQLPFFLVTHYGVKLFAPENADGFSVYYHRMIDVAGVTYAFLGFIFLYLFLHNWFEKKVALLTAFILLIGTNAFYYAIDETGMSHIYSFFLFSAFLYYFSKTDFSNTNIKRWILLGVFSGLILVVRPINVLFFPIVLFFNSTFNIENIKKNFLGLFAAVFTVFIVMLPQFLYWKYLSGKFIMDSYEGEGFDFLHPQLLKFWFSTHNGLFPYTPLWFFILYGLVLYVKQNRKLALSLLFYFFALSYIMSSWWSWNFGCGYGIRPMVEFLTVFSVGMAYFIQTVLKKNNYVKISVGLLFTFLIYLSINGFYHFDGCWYHGLWDYKELWEMLTHS